MPLSAPAMPAHLPIYCETGHPFLGMAEPVNTITNAAILIAAYFAYRYARKSRVRLSTDLVLLLFLLTWVGIGSALWHGLRTPWALTLDWIPGVLYLLVLTVLWIRQLYGWFAGVFGMVAMTLISIAGVGYLGKTLAAITPNLFALPMFATVTVVGVIMVSGAWTRYGRGAGLLGVSILATGLTAAFARSIDLLICPYVPTGTHFLWHIGLSTAACLGFVLIVQMKKARAGAPV